MKSLALQDVAAGVADAERQVREDLAACYRLAAHFGWDDLISTHISARVPGPDHQFLINPFGMLFSEICASDLVKVSVGGDVLGETAHNVNAAGFVIHSAIHMAREDAHCVMHLHSKDGVAVSAQAAGLLPLNQTALTILDDVATHEFEGPALDADERSRLQADLGSKNLMLLRNHGTLAVGASCAEAFARMYRLEWACTVQIRTLAGGAPLHLPSQASIDRTTALARSGMARPIIRELLWPALKRMLDRMDPSYRR